MFFSYTNLCSNAFILHANFCNFDFEIWKLKISSILISDLMKVVFIKSWNNIDQILIFKFQFAKLQIFVFKYRRQFEQECKSAQVQQPNYERGHLHAIFVEQYTKKPLTLHPSDGGWIHQKVRRLTHHYMV